MPQREGRGHRRGTQGRLGIPWTGGSGAACSTSPRRDCIKKWRLRDSFPQLARRFNLRRAVVAVTARCYRSFAIAPTVSRRSDLARRSARRRTAAKRRAPARSLQGESGENGAANDRYTLGVGGRRPSPQRQLATSSAIYPHLSSAALTASRQCPTLARY